MSLMSDSLAAALSILSDAKGESLTYATTLAGSYSALTGFVLHIDRLPAPAFSEESQAGEVAQTATLKGPLSPALARGYVVLDGNGQYWAIEGVKTEAQQVCTCQRTKVTKRGPNRGDFA